MAKQNSAPRVKVKAPEKATHKATPTGALAQPAVGQQPPATPTPGAAQPTDAKEFVDLQSQEDLITVHVPAAFIITQDDHVQVSYQVGTQDMPRAHAEHWYAQAVGVKVHNKKTRKTEEE